MKKELQDILSRVDHTLLSQTATWAEIRTICDDGVKYGCASVCIPASYVRRAADVARRDADACATVLHAVVADGPDLRPGGGLAQQRVVDAAENILQLFFHMSNSLI